ncbi:MAG: type II toxin-antitoxin system HigB family toxin [Azoarcus sp.]|jgi:mRNA interferase HigB|nr:type II toxin-antitoxin system HigB family toxin [Azoarcus sp.]
MKLISNRALREFADIHPDAAAPLQLFRVRIEKGTFRNFAALGDTFRGVDKVGNLYVFNVGGNKCRIAASIAFSVQTIWIKAVMTHAEYDEGRWK